MKPKQFEAESDTMEVWYLDNGANNHLSGNREFFFELDDTITGLVNWYDSMMTQESR